MSPPFRLFLAVVGALVLLCLLMSCATIEASNEYMSVELCAYWEHES